MGSEGSLSRAVEVVCGGSVGAVRPITTLGDSEVYEMDLSGRRVVVKQRPVPPLIDIEVWGLERLASVGMRVPAVLGVDTSAAVHPLAFYVSEYIAGVPISESAGDAGAALFELGEQLRAVHEVHTEGHGLIGGGGVVGVGMFSSGADAMRMFMEFGLSGLESSGWIDSDAARRVRALFDAHSFGLDASPPRLLHGDLKVEHVVVDPNTGRLAGVLDPHPWSGEPAYDLARLVATGYENMRAPLLSGYGPLSPDENERWKLHKVSFLLAITFGHRINDSGTSADLSAWNDRLLAALRGIDESP